MKNIIKLLGLTIIATVIISGCSKEEVSNPESDEKFILDATDIKIFGTVFLMLTNQEGEVLLDTITDDITGLYTIDVDAEDNIDVTYGYEFPNSFILETYRDIPSGFKLDLHSFSCDQSLLNGDTYQSVEITIDGIDDYEFIHVPLSSREVLVDSVNNQLVITGRHYTEHDLMVTVLPKGSTTYLNKVIRNNEFIKPTTGEWQSTVLFNHFTESIVNEHRLNVDEDWLLEISVTDNESNSINIFDWNNYEDYQHGNMLKSFVSPELEFDQIRFSLRNGHIHNGYSMQKLYDQFPGDITLSDMDIEINHADKDGYQLNLDNDHDYSIVSIYYLQNANLSSWRIYSSKESKSDYMLPQIPAEFLNQADKLNAQIDTPHAFNVELIKLDDAIIGDHGEGLERINNINCFEYDAFRKGFEF